MNVFVLSTGRSGTRTFAEACRHMTNYAAAHESRNCLDPDRACRPYDSFRYPPDHIEVDNRLAWFLGALEREYGDGAFYVHLLRRGEDVARSYLDRGRDSILFHFASSVLQYWGHAEELDEGERLRIGLLYWETVNLNIEAFLASKTNRMTIWLHEIEKDFTEFWERIGAEGDLEAALAEWRIYHNATDPGQRLDWRRIERAEVS